MIETNPNTATASLDLGAVKSQQQASWASGDYGVVGTTLQIVSELLCETAGLRPGERVLDVATGNGGTALAAARRHCVVTGVDYVPSLLAQARRRADAEGYAISFDEGDAEALPYAEDSFDVVTSTFGVMFAPDHQKAASELVRVTRPGGRIALANWSPDGFVGRLFRTIGAHNPPPAGLASPALWGTESYLRELFGGAISDLRLAPATYTFRYASAGHFIDVFRAYYGPVLKAYESVGDDAAAALTADLEALLASVNTDGAALVVPGAYVQALAIRA